MSSGIFQVPYLKDCVATLYVYNLTMKVKSSTKIERRHKTFILAPFTNHTEWWQLRNKNKRLIYAMKGGKWNKKAFNTLIYPFLKAKWLEWDKCLNRISSTRLFSQGIKRSNMNWLSQFPRRSSCNKKHRNCHLLNKTKSQRNSRATWVKTRNPI